MGEPNDEPTEQTDEAPRMPVRRIGPEWDFLYGYPWHPACIGDDE